MSIIDSQGNVVKNDIVHRYNLLAFKTSSYNCFLIFSHKKGDLSFNQFYKELNVAWIPFISFNIDFTLSNNVKFILKICGLLNKRILLMNNQKYSIRDIKR